MISAVITCNWGGLGRARFTRIKNGVMRGHSRERFQRMGKPQGMTQHAYLYNHKASGRVEEAFM